MVLVANSECFIIAVDGIAASGKGTLSKGLAKYFNFDFLDTGLLYRIAAYSIKNHKLDVSNLPSIISHIKTIDFLTNYNITNLYTEEISTIASKVLAPLPAIREIFNQVQRDFPIGKKGAVIDGRDIGTIIFPNANLKFFITADLNVRAERRYKQLKDIGKDIILDKILEELRERDERDIRRKTAPTVPASDAIIINTTHLEADLVLERAVSLSRKAIGLLAT